MRTKLTNEEYNAVQRLTAETKLDTVFDVCTVSEEKDGFIDFENGSEILSLEEGFKILYDSLGYPLKHDVSKEDAELIASLLVEFGACNEDGKEWLLKEDED